MVALYTPRPPAAGDRFVETSVGCVHVRSWGDGPSLFLLHSNGHSWHEFDAVVEELARSFTVFAWDMPGQGESDPVHPRTSVEAYAGVLIEVLDALSLGHVLLAGCSIGAFIAADAAARHPERVSGVALVEFAYRTPEWWQSHWAGVRSMFTIAVQSPQAVAARHVRTVDDAYVAQWNADRSVAGPQTLAGVMWAIREFDMTAALQALRCPVLVVFGADGPTLECRADIERDLPEGARIAVLDGAGHFPAFDAPDAFAAAVRGLAQ